MLQKLHQENYELLIPFLTNSHLFLNILPIIHQTFTGEIWVNDLENPSFAYVFDSRHGHFILGQFTDNKELLREFIIELFKKRFSNSNKFFYLLYADEWTELLQDSSFFNKMQSSKKTRQLYKFAKNSTKSIVPEGFTILPVDENLLKKDLENIKLLQDELTHMWGDPENFFRIGFGTCAIFQNSLAGFCLGEYFVNIDNEKKFGIGIETFPEFQQKGIATAMALSLVEMGLANDYEIYWDCFKDNIASAKTALKVGFVLDMEYNVLLGHF